MSIQSINNSIRTPEFRAQVQSKIADLELLAIFSKNQDATRVCIDKDGQFYGQEIDVNIFVQFFQWIDRVFNEMSFATDVDRVNFLVAHVHEVLNETAYLGMITGVDTGELRKVDHLNRTFTGKSFEQDKQDYKKVCEKVGEILRGPHELHAEELSKLELFSKLAENFAQAAVVLKTAMAALPSLPEVVAPINPQRISEIVNDGEFVEIVL